MSTNNKSRSSTLGKKFLVIPSETYKSLTEPKKNIYTPERNELMDSEKQMSTILDSNIPEHETVKLFTEQHDKFKCLLKSMNSQ